MKSNMVLIIRKGFLRYAISIFCSILIIMGMAYLVYSSPGATTIGEDISTTNLTVNGSATTTGNFDVSGVTTLATTTLSGDLDLSLKQLKNVVLEKLADFPSSPVEGQMFWSTATSTPYWYDEANTRWRTQDDAATLVVAASDSRNKWKADYIADGTDDQVEIKAAIDALPDTGGKVVLLEGTFSVSASTTLPSNVTLQGQGMGATKIDSPNGDVAAIITNRDWTNGNTNIIISDMEVDGNGSGGYNYTDGSAVFFERVDHGRLENLYVHHSDGPHNIEIVKSQHIVVTGCRLEYGNDDNLSISDGAYTPGGLEGDSGTDDVRVVNNTSLNNASGSCFEADDGPVNLIFANNFAKDCGAGIKVHKHDSSTCPNAIIEGNVIIDCTSGVSVSGNSANQTEGVIIADNWIEGGTNGIYSYWVKNAIIKGNRIKGPTSYGIYAGFNYDPIIQGNRIDLSEDCTGDCYGIYNTLGTGIHGVVSNNNITVSGASWDTAIYLLGTAGGGVARNTPAVINGNLINGNGTCNGIKIAHIQHITITGNNLFNTPTAIYGETDTDNVAIVGNSIYNATTPISAVGANSMIENNIGVAVERIALEGTGTLTDGSAAGKTVLYMDDTPAGEWTDSEGAGNVVVSDNFSATYRKPGLGARSLKISFAAGAGVEDGAQYVDGQPYDWSGDENVGFWLYSSIDLDANDIAFELTDDGGEQVVLVPVAIPMNTWMWVSLTLPAADADKDVISEVRVVQKVDKGAFNLYMEVVYKWDNTEQTALAQNIVTDGILSVLAEAVGGNVGTWSSLTEYTDYFIDYGATDNFVVISDQSANRALINYKYQ